MPSDGTELQGVFGLDPPAGIDEICQGSRYFDVISNIDQVDSAVSAATVLSAQDRQINVVATEQVNDDSLEEFLANVAKRIGV